MRCCYMHHGQQCPNQAVDARLVDIYGTDRLVVLLCDPHCEAYDAIQWGRRERARVAAQDPPEVGACFADDVH